jgi:hypothetical protein
MGGVAAPVGTGNGVSVKPTTSADTPVSTTRARFRVDVRCASGLDVERDWLMLPPFSLDEASMRRDGLSVCVSRRTEPRTDVTSTCQRDARSGVPAARRDESVRGRELERRQFGSSTP